jgi:hypothetical protein
MSDRQTAPEGAADIHDLAVIRAALAVLGTCFLRRPITRIGDACESLNWAKHEIEARINDRRDNYEPIMLGESIRAWIEEGHSDEQTADRNDYEKGYRRGMEIAIKVGTRIAQGLMNEYQTGAYEAVKAIEKVLKNAK